MPGIETKRQNLAVILQRNFVDIRLTQDAKNSLFGLPLKSQRLSLCQATHFVQ